MNERVIEIILYLVSQIRQDTPIELIDVKRLSADGYTDVEIGAAFSWIADHAVFGSERSSSARTGFRVLHESERMLFETESYGYLLQLIEIGVLTDMDLEIIINRAQVAGLSNLDVLDVKELVGMLLAELGELGYNGSRLMLTANDTIH